MSPERATAILADEKGLASARLKIPKASDIKSNPEHARVANAIGRLISLSKRPTAPLALPSACLPPMF
jgi:hypothetical protein